MMSSKVLEVGSVNVFEKYNFCHQNTTIGTFKYSFLNFDLRGWLVCGIHVDGLWLKYNPYCF